MRRLSAKGSLTSSMPFVRTLPKPSIQVIYKKVWKIKENDKLFKIYRHLAVLNFV